MKKIYLVLPVLVVVLTLFAATNVVAQVGHCDASYPDDVVRMERWECFKGPGGYVVEIVPTPEGNFPEINASGNSVFTYKITKAGSTKSISHVDIIIPRCPQSLVNVGTYSINCTPSCTGSQPYYSGAGESSTGFGLGLKTADTLKWYFSGTGGTVSLTLPGKVFASPNAMLVKVGSSTNDFAYGQILAPACAQIPVQAFPVEVPNTTKREVNISGIDLCIESTDQSGCPTKLYSCTDPLGPPVCDCSTNYQEVWTKETILDAQINKGQLYRAWSDRDSRCPKTYWHTEGSCKLYVSGMGYTSSYTYAGISGYVKNAVGAPLAGVTMNACKTTPTTGCQTPVQTNSTGYFSLCFPIAPWSGWVTPVKTGYTFTQKHYPYPGITVNNSPTNELFSAQ